MALKSKTPASLIIEVRSNEGMPRRNAAQVPYDIDEIIADAIECAEAGATVYHWHARDPFSAKTIDDHAAFIAVAKGIRAQSDIVLKPTTGFNRESADARMAHIGAMVKSDVSYVDMIPLDNFSANSDVWDPAANQFTTGNEVYTNTRGHIIDVIGIANKLGIPVSPVCPDAGSIRTGICFQDMGILSARAHWELVFSGAAYPLAALPSIPALQAMISAIPYGASWSALCTGGDILPLLGAIIPMGGHVAVGLGDFAHTRFGLVRNADLVRKVKLVADVLGRPIANIAETCELLGLRRHLYR